MADPLLDIRVVHEAAPLVEIGYTLVGVVYDQVHNVAVECERFLNRSQKQLCADTPSPPGLFHKQRVHDELHAARRRERCSPDECAENASYKLD